VLSAATSDPVILSAEQSSGHWDRANVPRSATREVGVALHIGGDNGNERLPFPPGEEPFRGLAGFDGFKL
jgi:hypothetical protein